MALKKGLKVGGKILAEALVPDAVDIGAKISEDVYENQKSKIKIPALNDVHIDEAMRILKEEFNLVPTALVCKPNAAYANERENEVMSSEPRFGTRVDSGTPVKLCYLTAEVIEKSKVLLGKEVREFQVPRIIGVNVYETIEE